MVCEKIALLTQFNEHLIVHENQLKKENLAHGAIVLIQGTQMCGTMRP